MDSGEDATSTRRRRSGKKKEEEERLALFHEIQPLLYPSLNPALVLGNDISHFCDSLMYGELSAETLALAFHLLWDDLPAPGQGKLIDIGSGIGKQVFCAACLYPWGKCCGIEIYTARARLASQALERWQSQIIRESSSYKPLTREIEFIEGDVVDYGVEGYDVILLVSAAFTDSLMKQIARVLDDAPLGVLAICITKAIPSSKWQVVHQLITEEPWGRAGLIIQQKIV